MPITDQKAKHHTAFVFLVFQRIPNCDGRSGVNELIVNKIYKVSSVSNQVGDKIEIKQKLLIAVFGIYP